MVELLVYILLALTSFFIGVYSERFVMWSQVNKARENATREQARADKAIDMLIARSAGVMPVSDFTQKEIVEPRREEQRAYAKQVAEYFATEVGGPPYETDSPVPEE